MQKNLYYQTFYNRENILKRAIYDFLYNLSSYPRLLLQVFIRKNMGERCFKLSSAITTGILFVLFPIVYHNFVNHWFYYSRTTTSDFFVKYSTYYLFMIGYFYFAYQRWLEVLRNPSVFDFKRFSFSTGDINPFFYNLKLSITKPDVRRIETLYEPGVFFVAGLLLWLMGQGLGGVLLFTSVVYSISYFAAYKKGDDMVMDIIDKMIINEEMESSFVDGLESDKTKGFQFYGQRPDMDEVRRRVMEAIILDDEEKKTYAR